MRGGVKEDIPSTIDTYLPYYWIFLTKLKVVKS